MPSFRFPATEPGASSEALVDLRRRAFCRRLAGGAAALLSVRAAAEVEVEVGVKTAPPLQPPTGAELEEPWATLAEAQAHLFPSEPHAPGAREVHALPYLRQALAAPDVSDAEREFLFAGSRWLAAEAGRRGGRFGSLPESDREALLRQLAAGTDGANWIALVLHYVIEAVLSDPAYGGNPDGIGWRWLGYTPGFPRPPADRLYTALLER